jgi:hypothetical protein
MTYQKKEQCVTDFLVLLSFYLYEAKNHRSHMNDKPTFSLSFFSLATSPAPLRLYLEEL